MLSNSGSLSSTATDAILCYYTNTTTSLQRTCFAGVSRSQFERVIFPNQRILFEASPDALLEVQTCDASGTPTIRHIPCTQLQVNQPDAIATGIGDAVTSAEFTHDS